MCGLAFLPILLAATVSVQGQAVSSYPHDYPGKPAGDFGPEWQSCTLLSNLPHSLSLIPSRFPGDGANA